MKKNNLSLTETLRPGLNSEHVLFGPAAKLWDTLFQSWLHKNKFHCVLWGPPGSGKTSLALMLKKHAELSFAYISSTKDGVKEIREAIKKNAGGILFIDEIHRLNSSAQDSLLQSVEQNEIWLIAATTESPQTALNRALLSRVRTLYVAPLTKDQIEIALTHALNVLEQGQQNHSLNSPETNDKQNFNSFYSREKFITDYFPKIIAKSFGDLRFAYNLMELLFYCENKEQENTIFENCTQTLTTKKQADYLSAMIKSMRGSDPDAALFYAFLLLEQGEDPLILLRRAIVFASEDVGNADPQAITLAVSCMNAFEKIGMPEGRIPIAQCISYLASTFKSNRAYTAIDTVKDWIKKTKEDGLSQEPPIDLTLKGKDNYKYPHNYKNAFIHKNYLPESIIKIKKETQTTAYLPSEFGHESLFLKRLSGLWSNTMKES